jgi:hypothetical protein
MNYMNLSNYSNGIERTNHTYNSAMEAYMLHWETFKEHGVRTIWRLNPNTEAWQSIDHTVVTCFELGGYDWVIVEVAGFSDRPTTRREALYQPVRKG